mgnify:CR=1 FL=1
MMRLFVIAVSFLMGITCFAQADSVSLKQAIAQLDKALVAKDDAALSSLLDKKLSYGHSNGWVQTKSDIKNDFASGKLVYRRLESSGFRIELIGKEWAVVRMETQAAGALNGNDFEMKMHVLQVWKMESKGWQLITRQSVRL